MAYGLAVVKFEDDTLLLLKTENNTEQGPTIWSSLV